MALIAIKDKGLRELFENGATRHIGKQFHENAIMILDHLDNITDIKDCMGVKDFHALKGTRKGQYAMHVTGNWCITFKWNGTDVTVLAFEDYH
ncbi:type II toxin-antitoxin system RelE/ParE family toxin [uncultured Thalassospira sp.]|jgi:proteic killer suppression protein|uniref:type II toxin-antitoxin system RelE/ParE family toxin n=1 Tax=uncultured Thalassospira sp. TaxID=404382 RepID=UPI0030DB0A79|tara:strand:+ start:597 stop:875 length:279 start_codon:yes stop_codon:yes gene_type:complete